MTPIEAAGECVRKMIPEWSVWFPSIEQGDAIARAAVLAFLDAAKRESADPGDGRGAAITTIVALTRMAEASRDD